LAVRARALRKLGSSNISRGKAFAMQTYIQSSVAAFGLVSSNLSLTAQEESMEVATPAQ
jgi:hypothetical protein